MGNDDIGSESAFDELVDETFRRIEEAIDDSDADVDYDTNGGVLTIYCEDQSQIIFSRQTAQRQLWMAARSGGFHYNYDDAQGCWVSTRDAPALASQFMQAFQDQSAGTITINL